MKQVQAAAPQVVNRKKNADGSEIGFDAAGNIVATTDALGEKREFQLEARSGRLMVRRFGIWSKPEQARLDEHGNLYFRRGDTEILERVDGVHIQANRTTGVTIKNDQKNRIEVIQLANGEVWKRHTTGDIESFWIWKNEQLNFMSETFFKPTRQNARTPSGFQPLSYVSRREESYERGSIVREKFCFHNEINQERHASIALQLGRGMLMVRDVAAVVTVFKDEKPIETRYQLDHSTTLRVDLPMWKAVVEDLVEIRSFVDNSSLSVAFRKANGNEQILNLIQS